jgi:hypothetical protein
MATAANTIQHRIVSILCLFAIILVALPPVACASTAGHSMAHMTAAHCDPCCPTELSATALCCLAHSQPSEPAAQPSHPVALRTSALPVLERERLTAPRIARAAILGVAPPPLLHPILRI